LHSKILEPANRREKRKIPGQSKEQSLLSAYPVIGNPHDIEESKITEMVRVIQKYRRYERWNLDRSDTGTFRISDTRRRADTVLL